MNEIKLTDAEKETRISDGRKYIDKLTEIEIKNTEAFDKSILALSTGSLGLSIAFLDKVVPYKESICLWLLIIAWVFLSATIILNLISHFIACGECQTLKKYSVQFYFKFDDYYRDLLNNFKSKTSLINIISACTYILSICIIVVFVSINIL